MAGEKNFETRLKKWLETKGIYSLGTPQQDIHAPPIGYYEKRWGGGFSKSGLPDMHIVVKGICIEAELKSSTGRPSELQKQKLIQINQSGGFGMVLYPEGFAEFKKIVEGVIKCNGHIQELIHLKNAHSSIKCNILTD